MKKNLPAPLTVNRENKTTTQLKRLIKTHSEFNEQYLQELLVDHPDLLPVQDLRPDIGDLVCIGREVPAGNSGFIDNLYLSTGGYPVIVETKLWRNPQARREVLSQALDYTKEVARKDYDWLEGQWRDFTNKSPRGADNLFAAISEKAAEEFDEHEFIDRVSRALDRGDIISLIVGDGIESRLQALVSHLCKDSAHLRYSLALIELACYHLKGDKDLLIVPRIVREVEPIQRAYVKIDVAEGLERQISVHPIVEDRPSDQPKKRRTILSEEDFLSSLDDHIGFDLRRKVETFYNDLIDTYGLEPDFKTSAMMLKVPDPLGEKPSVSVIAFEREGRIYNTSHMPNQLKRAGVPENRVKEIVHNYWKALQRIDSGFQLSGASHVRPHQFVSISALVSKFDLLKTEIGKAVQVVRDELSNRAE